MSDAQKHQQCTEQFISLANSLKEDGYDIKLVSAALMSASGIYATYSVAGNSGGLNPSGVDKVVNSFRDCMNQVQEARKRDLVEAGAEIENEQS